MNDWRFIMAALALVGVASLGCFSNVSYNMDLTETQLDSQPVDGGMKGSSYEDEDIRIVWFANEEMLRFKLKNKSNQTIKLPWDEVVVVTPEGKTETVLHEGVKFIDRNESQRPSVIPAGAQIEDAAILSSQIYYQEPGEYSKGGWKTKPLMHNRFKNDEVKLEAGKNVGRAYRVLMPLEKGDQRREYIFALTVTGYEVVK